MTDRAFVNLLSMQAMLAQTASHIGADLVRSLEAENQGHPERARAYLNRATRRLGGLQHGLETFPDIQAAMRREGEDEAVLLDPVPR